MSKDGSHKPLIVVIGMHCSAASVLARALQELGVELGDQLVPPIEGDNDSFFCEDADISDFNTALLDAMGSAWDRLAFLDEEEPFSELSAQRETAVSLLAGKMKSTSVFGFQDPRVSILLPFWRSVFQQLGVEERYVIAIRDPLSVANSLLNRNGIPLEKGILLWAKHIASAFRCTQDKRKIVVAYDLMLESPARQIQRISEALNLSLDGSSRQRPGSFEVDYPSRDLRRHSVAQEELERSESVPAFVKQAYAWTLKLARDEVLFSDAELEAFWQRFDGWCSSFDLGCRYMDRMELCLRKEEVTAGFYKEENRRLSNKVFDVLGDLDAARQQLIQVNGDLDAARQQLMQVNATLGNLRKQQQEAIVERDATLESCRELQEAHKQALVERDEAQGVCRSYADDNALLREQLKEIFNSHSWRLTGGLRAIRRYLITRPQLALRRRFSKGR